MSKEVDVNKARANFMAMIGAGQAREVDDSDANGVLASRFPRGIGRRSCRLGGINSPTSSLDMPMSKHRYSKNFPVIVLGQGLGFTYREIGDEIGLTEQSVKNCVYFERRDLGLKSTISAIKTMVSEGLITSEQLTKGLDFSKYDLLTEAEKKLLKALAESENADSNKELGKALKVSPKTVKNHMSSIFNKLGVRSRIQAAMIELFRPKVEEVEQPQSPGKLYYDFLAVSNIPS
jgi:DNA-binding CsgD family transcriptional regulator